MKLSQIENLIHEELQRWHLQEAAAKKKYKEVAAATIAALDLFDISESEIDANKTSQAKKAIQKGLWEKPNAQAYHKSLFEHAKHPEMLTAYSVGDLATMQLFKLQGAEIGFAIKGGDEIVAVHNNEAGVGGVGELLMEAAIQHGGRVLDHFDVPILSKIYGNIGFKETERFPFDPQYAPPGFTQKYGEPDIIVRKYHG